MESTTSSYRASTFVKNIRLASESSLGSEDSDESIYSIQDRDTDIARDLSDEEIEKSDCNYEYELEYLDNDDLDARSSHCIEVSPEAASAAATVFLATDKDYVTDVEDSESDSSVNCRPHKIYNCRSCDRKNLFGICYFCFQKQKKTRPPRPSRKKKRNKDEKESKGLTKTCDSGLGSSQESTASTSNKDTNESNDGSPTKCQKRGRDSNSTPKVDSEFKKPKSLDQALFRPDPGIQPSTSRQALPCTSAAATAERLHLSSPENDTSDQDSNICMFCANAPVDSIFVHHKIGHQVSCYTCGKKIMKSTGKCPICNTVPISIVKVFKS